MRTGGSVRDLPGFWFDLERPVGRARSALAGVVVKALAEAEADDRAPGPATEPAGGAP